VTALAFSPNGSLLTCGFDNGRLKLWEMVSGYADDHPGHEDAIIALAFSQGGKIIASASHSRTIRLWDIRQVCYRFQLQKSWVGVHCLAFSADGKLLASASLDKQIRLWNLAQKNC
ncbi:WD40-repeat-containing domain protein, partial [Phaeosphaeriaceae sp. PMI808]